MTAGAPYRPDRRSEADVVAALTDAALATPLPPSLRGAGTTTPQTWADLLVRDGALADEAEPSQALLRAVARLYAGLVEHADCLPARARGWLMAERLGVSRLRIVPDRVVVVVDGDPRRAPSFLKKDSLLKAGKGPLGERLYATTEALTVLGAPVLGAHSHRVLPSGADVAAWRRAELSSGKGPVYAPFGDLSDPAAPHELYVASDLLHFTKGTLTATLTFDGVRVDGATPASMSGLATVLRSLCWQISTADGVRKAEATAKVRGESVALAFSLVGGSAPQPVGDASLHFLRASFPEQGTTGFDRATALGFSFAALRLRVSGSDVPPDAGYAGDGLLDVTKEFEPFGPVPRRGDSFYLRLDEAFGKALTVVAVSLTRLNPEVGLRPAEYGAAQSQAWVTYANRLLDLHHAGHKLKHSDFGTPEFTVLWQRYDGSEWTWFAEQTENFSSVGATLNAPSSQPFSSQTSVGGSPGNFVRAYLFHGDFGWTNFMARTAENARLVAAGDGADVEAATPPDPPVVSLVRISYTTEEISTATGRLRLFARNALSSVTPLATLGPGDAIYPFHQGEDGFDGAFFLGIGEPPLGEVVTVYARIDEAGACTAVQEDTTVVWQYRAADGAWHDLPCVDGTSGLRQSGVLRFVAPLDWAVGAPEADETGGCWIRARTRAPSAAGRIRILRTDAVEAAYRLAPGHEGDDPTPAAELAPGAITGLRTPVPGIKKVASPAPSWGGRGPEPDASFFARSGGVLRHRNRAVTAWDVERLVADEFPELALVRCLPHHSASSGEEAECAPGRLAVVPVPRSEERAPVPSVRLAGAIEAFVLAQGAVDISVAVLCPLYQEVGVTVTAHLVGGVPAATSREELEAGLRRFLHPLSTARDGGFGEPLYRSAVVRFLEEQPTVDHVSGLDFLPPHAGLERVDVDACRGLVASAAVHEIFAKAVL